MNWSSLISRTSSCNQQPGADQTKNSTSPEGPVPAGTNLPLLSGPSGALSSLNFGYKTVVTKKKKNTIFDNLVTIFFRFQRKLEEKNYPFKNSCPEAITLPIGDGQGGLVCYRLWVTKSGTRLSDWAELIPLAQSFLDHLSRPYLILETKSGKKKGGGQSLLKSYLFITKFGKWSYRISCAYLYVCMSQCVSLFFGFFL